MDESHNDVTLLTADVAAETVFAYKAFMWHSGEWKPNQRSLEQTDKTIAINSKYSLHFSL